MVKFRAMLRLEIKKNRVRLKVGVRFRYSGEGYC